MTSSTSPSQIRDSVRRFALGHDLLAPGPLVVAVSGGTDSTALLLLLADLAAEGGLVLHAAHFDHRLRRTGAADAQFAADLAARVGATIRVGKAERVPPSEDDARRARYAFLRRVAAERGATAIATGHTRDDQAETVLLHLARGSGIAGLAGMRAARDGIVRPLLAIGRAETTAVCAAAGIVPREDPTNRSLRYARNRIRRRVLPELAAINPQIVSALARLADTAAEVSASHRARAAALLEAALTEDGIDLDGLGDDPVLREEALALAWERERGQVLSARQRAALAREGSRADGSAMIDLPGGRAEREYRRLRLVPRAHRHAVDEAAGDPVLLRPGETAVWQGWRFAIVPAAAAPAGAPLVTGIAPDSTRNLAARSRRPGDRMAGPLGAKVQDVLVDAKVPSRLRSRIPMVVNEAGEVAWIPGVRTAWNGAPEGLVLVAYPPDGMAAALRGVQNVRSGE